MEVHLKKKPVAEEWILAKMQDDTEWKLLS